MSDQAVFVIIAAAAALSSGVTVMAMTRAGRSPRKRGQAMAARHWFPRPIGAAGSHMLVMGLSYAIFSLSLLLQGQRWHQTPAYHNLLIIMPSGTWGVFFGAVALLLIAGAYQIRPLWLPYTAVLLGFMLTACWDIAFIVRWATNDSTTPETWVSWAVFAYILLRAAVLIERERTRETPPPHRDVADG